MSVVIKVENVYKQYRLGEVGTGSLKDDLIRWGYKMMGREDPFLRIGEENDRTVKAASKYVWALKDINFEVKQGEILGIIGRNGAGKSTLLKILSRTTGPTKGTLKMKGRVASLLEVGTGFHGELSGRENIYLNGAIMGMHKAEINSKLDEIIDFAGVEKYIDTPVKRYSSGMYVRLAFGVAAHLEPDIMIVDEVLAVGDAEFQKRAIRKMKEVSTRNGRTVLFVSHNMASIQALCSKCIYMRDGKVMEGPANTDILIENYLQTLQTNILHLPIYERLDREGNGEVKVTNIKIVDRKDREILNLLSGKKIKFVIEFIAIKNPNDGKLLEIIISISRKGEHLVTVMSSKYLNYEIKNKLGNQSVNFVIENLPLMTGTYSINVMIRKDGVVQDWVQEAMMFEVENGDYYKTGLNMPESHKGVYLNYTIENA